MKIFKFSRLFEKDVGQVQSDWISTFESFIVVCALFFVIQFKCTSWRNRDLERKFESHHKKYKITKFVDKKVKKLAVNIH